MHMCVSVFCTPPIQYLSHFQYSIKDAQRAKRPPPASATAAFLLYNALITSATAVVMCHESMPRLRGSSWIHATNLRTKRTKTTLRLGPSNCQDPYLPRLREWISQLRLVYPLCPLLPSLSSSALAPQLCLRSWHSHYV